MTLLESMSNRCISLEHVVGLTGLTNVKIVQGRAGNRSWDKILALCDVAIARAIAELKY